MLFRSYLNTQLTRVLDGLADPSTRHLVRVAYASANHGETGAELVAANGELLPASHLADHLTSDRVIKSRSVVLDAALTHVDDVYTALDGVANTWDAESRLINVSYNRLWRPFVKGFRRLSRSERVPENWIPPEELVNQLEQTGFDIVERRTAVILPVPIPVIGSFLNRWIAPLPILRLLCVYNIVVARPQRMSRPSDPSVSVIKIGRAHV